MPAVGAGHTREQKVTGIGYLLVPEHKEVASKGSLLQERSRAWPAPTVRTAPTGNLSHQGLRGG